MIGRKLGFQIKKNKKSEKSDKSDNDSRAGRSKRRKLYYLTGCIAVAAVATVTAHMLTLPGVTMEAEPVEPICGLEEHTHDSSCYSNSFDDSVADNVIIVSTENEVQLICGKEEHTHTDTCYPQETLDEEASQAEDSEQSEQSDEDTDSEEATESEEDTATEETGTAKRARRAAAATSDSSDRLDLSKYVTSEVLEYMCSDNGITSWTEVTDGVTLHGDDSLKLTIEYEDLAFETIKDSDYKAYYELPVWMEKSNSASIDMVYGDEKVGSFTSEGDYGVISFTKDWIDKHYQEDKGGALSGTIGMEAIINVEEVTSDTLVIGNKTVTIDYSEDTWLNKYGKIDIYKSTPTYTECDDGADTLTYKITVTTGDVPMSNVKVNDYFNDITYNGTTYDLSTFVSEIVGVTAGADESTISNSDALSETSTKENFTHGTLSYSTDGNLVWNIGDMSENETRTLTYTVKLNKNYTGMIITGELLLQNVADLSVNGEQRDEVSAPFKLKGSIGREKRMVSYTPGDDGLSGTIKFYIKINADSSNTYTVENLRINDMFKTGSGYNWKLTVQDITVTADSFELYDGSVTTEDEIANAKKNGKQIELKSSDITINEADLTINGQTVKRFSNFYCTIGDLKPGQTKTLIYSAKLNASFYTQQNGGQFSVYNYAGVRENAEKNSKDTLLIGGGTAPETLQTFTVTYDKWDKKLSPTVQAKNATLDMSSDEVYKKDGNTYSEVTDVDSFDVETGEYKYYVIINQDGLANVNNLELKDTLSDYLVYKGYMRVDAYAKITDDDIANIEAGKFTGTAQRTAWFDIEGLKSFDFDLADLGFEGSHAYVLTYYTKITYEGTDLYVSVTNDFEMSGSIGYGGIKYTFASMKVGVSSSVAVPRECQSEKKAWYCERRLVDGTGVECNKDGMYWYIKLSGTEIPAGTLFEDLISSSNHELDSADSFKGIYQLDADTYLADMKFEDVQSQGKELTDCYTLNWGEDGKSLDVTFNKEIEIEDGMAYYIIIRSELLSYPAHNKNEEYVNSLYQQFSGEQKVQVGDKVSYSVAAVETTTKGTNDKPFYFDGKTTWELGTTQKQFTGGWSDTATGYKVNDNIFRTFNFGVGSYVDYYVNTSRNGSLSGDVTFSDILPEGLEIQYLRNADFKASYEGYTKNVVIPELEEEIAKNPDTPWKKYSEYEKAYCESTTKYCYYYYNTETREVRWKLSDVKTKPNEGSNVKEISFQLICKIVDKDVLRGVKEGNFDNTVVVSQDGRVVDEASTQLRVEAESVAKSLDKDATTVTSSNGNNVVTGNKVTFKLEVNRFNEDFSSKMKSLTVIDKMCSSFTLLPETVKFTYNDGTELDKDLTKTVIEIKDDGETYMTFTVPSSQEVIITYSAKINADEEEVISSVSNEAEWKTEVSLIPSKWSMSNFSFKFGAGVKIAEKPSLKILKSDLDDATKALSGATFSVQEVEINSDGNITTVGDAHTGTTDENGELTFSTEDGDKWFSRNTIYAITETAAPDGYNAADTKYILVTTKGSTRTYDSRVEVIRGVADVCEVEIYDEPIKIGYVLPSAGGLGTYPIKAVGAVLITAGTASYVCVRRRKKRQNR